MTGNVQANRASSTLVRRHLHVSKTARERFGIDSQLFSLHGDLVVADYAAAERLAAELNRIRGAARYPALGVKAGELFAAGVWHEICHLVFKAYRDQVNPQVRSRAIEQLRAELGEDGVKKVLLAFAENFPAQSVQRGELSPEAYLEGSTQGEPHREIVLEELLLLWLENQNPALERMLELFDDSELKQTTHYPELIRSLEPFMAGEPGFGPNAASLLDLLAEPISHSPTSLEGQLDYMRSHWAPFLGARFERLLAKVLRAIDVIKEERERGPGGPPETFVLDADTLGVDRGPVEYERFSPDASWMPRVVMIAKSTYVWLDQLSRRYRRDISRLDQIPDEELDALAASGFTALWLIGLWERSEASRRIKHLRGQPDAVASAYALYDYTIAGDLGGEEAYKDLRDRAYQRSIRLASDMVPNHVGIDGRWVVERPDWFVQLDHSPYQGYTFTGPDLSDDERVGLYLEDHYYDGTDAAVVFKRVDRSSGEERHIYHGNDGTSMPWNDTAQLDYLKGEVREAVVQTILAVARRFPIIRFDAAMTLAKRHIQRLWYPPPGAGGAIPSRSHYGAMTPEAFEAALPEEFWREVVDRVAAEVPDTLLLAEAFWMMEGYFVRTLGMHRVYNSAFMNMLKREENDKYRMSLKNILEFEPEILKRFVNFMNNPDEETAVHQFGKDDKYFGVCALMATMPGLPMFGHGQIEGFQEKYGMEYRRPKLEEAPDTDLVARHRREIFPLLHRRAQFAEAENFHLFDLVAPEGHVNEDVFAYANRVDGHASLVVFNNKFDHARGRIRLASRSKLSEGVTLAEALGLKSGADDFAVFHNQISGLEHLYRSRDLFEHGLHIELDAFKYQVFVDIREIQDDMYGSVSTLHDELGGSGVASVSEAAEQLRLRPLHQALAEILREESGDVAAERLVDTLERAREHGFSGDAKGVAAQFRARVDALGALVPEQLGDKPTRSRLKPYLQLAERDRLVLSCLLLQESLGGDDTVALRLERFWRELLEGERDGLLLSLAVRYRPTFDQDSGRQAAATLLDRLAGDGDARLYLGVHRHDDVEWFNREAYRELVATLVRFHLVHVLAAERPGARAKARVKELAAAEAVLNDAEQQSQYRIDLLRAPAAAGASRAEPQKRQAETKDKRSKASAKTPRRRKSRAGKK